MNGLTPAFPALLEAIAAGASGELICVTSSMEVHVYLQSGRIAWATDSGSPFAFSRYLLEHTSVTKEVFTEVLTSCQRDRLPLGETLVAWKVATFDEIRSALRHQIRGAMATLRDATRARTIFLERVREFATYDRQLTFELAEVAGEPQASNTPPRVAATTEEEKALLARFRDAAPHASWLVLLDGEHVVATDPHDSEAMVAVEVLRHTVLDEAKLVVLRTASATTAGVALPKGHRSLWCGVGVESKLGVTVSALCDLAQIEQHLTPTAPSCEGTDGSPVVRAMGPSPANKLVGALPVFMDRAPEVIGIVLLDRGEPVCSCVRAGLDEDRVTQTVQRRAPVLSALPPSESGARSDVEELGYRLRSLLTCDAGAWCFGAELDGEHRRSVWMLTDRRSAQGLGWAYLTSLVRQLAGAEAR